jgi:salicylate biosynthesis isochorismate synthase/menaquinone-specific isochorismate synthase
VSVQAPYADAPRESGLRALLETRLDRANATGTQQLLAIRMSASEVDPLAAWAHWSGTERFFWERPLTGQAFAGLGCELAIEMAPGPDRFAEASARSRSLFATLECVGEPAPAAAGPLLLGGFSFDAEHEGTGEWAGYPAGRLVLPELMLVRQGPEAWCTLARVVSPGARLDDEWAVLEHRLGEALALCSSDTKPEVVETTPSSELGPLPMPPFEPGLEYRVRADRPHDVYCAQVASALDAMKRGNLDKVVVARSLEVEHPGRFDVPTFLERLRRIYPSCVTFALGRGESTWIGASPERLIRLTHSKEGAQGEVRSGALAGSAPRGKTPEEDAWLGKALQSSVKERAEHAAVVEAIRAALEDVCGELDAPEQASLMKIEGIQHLETPLRGRLLASAAGTGVLELLDRLHPTPAVGGLPRRDALEWIARFEGLERGWYAGPLGFVDADGGGEFWVSLRSGLIRNSLDGEAGRACARLFGGAGIVPGSVPQSELAETRLKLRALLAPLTEI